MRCGPRKRQPVDRFSTVDVRFPHFQNGAALCVELSALAPGDSRGDLLWRYGMVMEAAPDNTAAALPQLRHLEGMYMGREMNVREGGRTGGVKDQANRRDFKHCYNGNMVWESKNAKLQLYLGDNTFANGEYFEVSRNLTTKCGAAPGHNPRATPCVVFNSANCHIEVRVDMNLVLDGDVDYEIYEEHVLVPLLMEMFENAKPDEPDDRAQIPLDSLRRSAQGRDVCPDYWACLHELSQVWQDKVRGISVSCMAGRNRSPQIIVHALLAYYWFYNYEFNEVALYVQALRPIAEFCPVHHARNPDPKELVWGHARQEERLAPKQRSKRRCQRSQRNQRSRRCQCQRSRWAGGAGGIGGVGVPAEPMEPA